MFGTKEKTLYVMSSYPLLVADMRDNHLCLTLEPGKYQIAMGKYPGTNLNWYIIIGTPYGWPAAGWQWRSQQTSSVLRIVDR